jgi:hypothetical protein
MNEIIRYSDTEIVDSWLMVLTVTMLAGHMFAHQNLVLTSDTS